MWNEKNEKKATFGEELTSIQMKELQVLLHDFSSVFSDKPGCTDLMEHHIVTDQSPPVRRPPYRLPHAYRELVKKELEEMRKSVLLRLPVVSGHRLL